MQTFGQHPVECTVAAPMGRPMHDRAGDLTDSDDSDVDQYDNESQFSFLQRTWLSKRFGYIQVLRDPANPHQMNVLQPHWQIHLARIVLSSEDTWNLTTLYPDDSGQERWYFDGWQGSRSRVLWTEAIHGTREIWDARLLAAIGKAAIFVDQHGLASQFGLGFTRLSSNEATGSPVSVGLCTSTRNRLWQLKRALPLNILHVWPHREWTKLRVVDCSSTDSTLRFLVEHCRFAIDIGLLEVYTTEDRMPYWHASIGKNTAHMVSKEDIVVNVDGDNLVGPDFPVDVARHMLQGFTVLHYHEHVEGTCGRIACPREDFCRIKGYDEDAMPMGNQDVDLLRRLQALPGARYGKVKGIACGSAIPNSKEQKVAACDPFYGRLKWTQMDGFNRSLFDQRRAAGQIRRNTHKQQIGVLVRKPDLKEDVSRRRVPTLPMIQPGDSTSTLASASSLDCHLSSVQSREPQIYNERLSDVEIHEQLHRPAQESETTHHTDRHRLDQQPQSQQDDQAAQIDRVQEHNEEFGQEVQHVVDRVRVGHQLLESNESVWDDGIQEQAHGPGQDNGNTQQTDWIQEQNEEPGQEVDHVWVRDHDGQETVDLQSQTTNESMWDGGIQEQHHEQRQESGGEQYTDRHGWEPQAVEPQRQQDKTAGQNDWAQEQNEEPGQEAEHVWEQEQICQEPVEFQSQEEQENMLDDGILEPTQGPGQVFENTQDTDRHRMDQRWVEPQHQQETEAEQNLWALEQNDEPGSASEHVWAQAQAAQQSVEQRRLEPGESVWDDWICGRVERRRHASETWRYTDWNVHREHADEQRLESQHAPRQGELDGIWIDVARPEEQYVIEDHLVTRTDAAGTKRFSVHWNRDWGCWQWGLYGHYYMQWLGKDVILWSPVSSKNGAVPWCWERREPAPRPNAWDSRIATQPDDCIWSDPAEEPVHRQEQALARRRITSPEDAGEQIMQSHSSETEVGIQNDLLRGQVIVPGLEGGPLWLYQ